MSEISKPLRVLREVRLFRGLQPPELAEVARAARHVTVRRDSYFYRQGDEAKLFYVLRSGRVRQTQTGPGGREILLQFVGPGQAFGVVAALAGRDYPVDARALGNCEALAWEGPAMATLMAAFPSIAFAVIEGYAAMVEELREQLRALATERVESRVARALLRLVEQAGWETDEGVLIDMQLSRRDLAEMTGTTLYTVSRILQGWERAGLVRVGRQRVAVRARDRLRAVVAA